MKPGNGLEATDNHKTAKFIGFAGFVLCALLLALCVSAEAQQREKVYRIGYLSWGKPLPNLI
jgi:hypothetical protein